MKEKTIREILPGRLRKMRIAAGMTSVEVSQLIGKNYKTILGWETGFGQPDADMLFQLARIYHVSSMDEFFADEDHDLDPFIVSQEETELLGQFRLLNESGRQFILSAVAAACGNPAMRLPSEPPEDK